MFVDITKVFIL